MNGKALVATVLMTVLTAGALGAEQLTTVAVVDIQQIYNSFYRDSRGVRELEDLRREYQQEIDEEVEELDTLRDRLARAEEQENESRVETLESQVERQRRYVEDLTSRRRRQLQERREELVSDDFVDRLQNAIRHVAEDEGYTVVLRSDQEGLQWWSSEVDISDQVLDRLRETEG
ncbi:MAG: OmpH family outer membrane protein [Spirochaetaceae bacterium]